MLGKTTRSAALCVAGILAAPVLAGPAAAAAPVPFNMADKADFATGVSTFTATAPLCSSGTFVDDVKVVAVAQSDQARSGAANVLIRSTYTCDDGSGTFAMLKHLHLTFTETGFTDTGPIEILGGTGAYAGVTGHGFASGATDFETNTGGGTTTGIVQLP